MRFKSAWEITQIVLADINRRPFPIYVLFLLYSEFIYYCFYYIILIIWITVDP